jgi:hypothetical protein
MSAFPQMSIYPGYEKIAEEWNVCSAYRVPPNSSIIAVGGQTGGVDWKFGTIEEQLTIIFEVYTPRWYKHSFRATCIQNDSDRFMAR